MITREYYYLVLVLLKKGWVGKKKKGGGGLLVRGQTREWEVLLVWGQTRRGGASCFLGGGGAGFLFGPNKNPPPLPYRSPLSRV